MVAFQLYELPAWLVGMHRPMVSYVMFAPFFILPWFGFLGIPLFCPHVLHSHPHLLVSSVVWCMGGIYMHAWCWQHLVQITWSWISGKNSFTSLHFFTSLTLSLSLAIPLSSWPLSSGLAFPFLMAHLVFLPCLMSSILSAFLPLFIHFFPSCSLTSGTSLVFQSGVRCFLRALPRKFHILIRPPFLPVQVLSPAIYFIIPLHTVDGLLHTCVFYLHPDILPHFILYSSLSVPHSGPFLSDIPSSSYGAFVFLPSQILVLFVEIAWHFHFALVHLILVPSHAFPFMSFYPLALVGSNGLVLCSYALFLALLLSSLASLCSSHCAFLSSVVIQILWPSLDFGSWPVWCAYFIGRCSHCVAWSVLFPLLYPLPWGWGYLLQSFTGAWGHLWFYHSILMVYLQFSFSLSFVSRYPFFLYGFFLLSFTLVLLYLVTISLWALPMVLHVFLLVRGWCVFMFWVAFASHVFMFPCT